MTHVIVGHKRTGTTHLVQYLYELHKFKSWNFISEFFLDTNYLSEDGIWLNDLLNLNADQQIKRKFNYFELLKENNSCHPFKVLPYSLINQGYESRLENLLNGFKIITIERDPFDSFLSHVYQDKTCWNTPHRIIKSNQDIKEFKFSINFLEIKSYLEKYKIEKQFIEKLDIFHTFKYEDLHSQHLEDFFGFKIKPLHAPMNIDYRSLVTNIDCVEKKFKEQYNANVVY